MMAITKGNKVKVKYTGKLSNGTVFDRTEDDKTLDFTVGEGKLIKGFEQCVIGMNPGETKTICISCEDGYGIYDESLIHKFPKDKMPSDPPPQIGMVIYLHLKNGAKIPAKIINIADDSMDIDLNHPLVGKELNFEITVVDVE